MKTLNIFYLLIYWTQKVYNDLIFLCSIVLPPVGHSSNHEYRCWNLQDNRAVVRIFIALLRFSVDSPSYNNRDTTECEINTNVYSTSNYHTTTARIVFKMICKIMLKYRLIRVMQKHTAADTITKINNPHSFSLTYVHGSSTNKIQVHVYHK